MYLVGYLLTRYFKDARYHEHKFFFQNLFKKLCIYPYARLGLLFFNIKFTLDPLLLSVSINKRPDIFVAHGSNSFITGNILHGIETLIHSWEVSSSHSSTRKSLTSNCTQMLQSVRLRISSEINRRKKKSVDDEGIGEKNRIWYRRKEPRKVKTEDHEAQLAAS